MHSAYFSDAAPHEYFRSCSPSQILSPTNVLTARATSLVGPRRFITKLRKDGALPQHGVAVALEARELVLDRVVEAAPIVRERRPEERVHAVPMLIHRVAARAARIGARGAVHALDEAADRFVGDRGARRLA